MSNIDDLKVGVEVGGNDTQERVSMTSASRHRFVNPDSEVRARQKRQAEDERRMREESQAQRVSVDYSTLPKPEPDPNIKRSPVDDLLGDKFEDYKKRRAAEMAQWEEEKQQQVEAGLDPTTPTEGSPMHSKNNPDDDSEFGVERAEDLTDYDYTSDDVSDFEDQSEDLYSDDDPFVTDDTFGYDEEDINDPVNYEETVVEPPVEEAAPVSNPIHDDFDVNVSSSSENIDIIDEDMEDESSEDEDNRDEILNHLKEIATEKLKPISRKLDISSFTVVKKPASNNKILQQQVKAAKWVAPAQDTVIMMKEYSGSELEALREYSESSRSFAMQNRKFHSIYDHLVSKKPSTYEAWVKSTPYSDVDHYFFASYIASFKGANFLPADCDGKNGCNEAFLTDDIDIMSMVKYKDDKAKHKFVELYQSEIDKANPKGLYVSEIVPISNTLAIGFKNPSIYSVIEVTTLSDANRNKYAHILDYIPYIDSLYIIDSESQTLTAIGYKIYPNNPTRTTISKIKAYYKALNTLTIDEFGTIKAYVRSINELANSGISYIYPSITCPKCGATIEEKPATAEELVFTRYQLGALINTSLK